MDAVDGKLILFGGFFECFDAAQGCDHTFYNEVWQYQVDFNTWFKAKPQSTSGQPDPRGFIASDHYVLTDSVIYFGGGRYNVDVTFFQFYNDMWQYFPDTDTFVKRIPTNTGPNPRLGPEMVILEHTAYIFGGIDNTFTYRNDLWKYNLRTDTWTLLTNGIGPGPRYSPQMQLRVTPTVRQIIVYAGNAPPPGSGNQWSDTWLYKIQSNTWELTPAVPGDNVGRTHGASSFYNNKFIISLGDIKNDTISCRTNEASGGQLPTNGTWYLNFREKSKEGAAFDYEEAFTRRPPTLKRVAYATFDKKLWVWGGYDFQCPCGQNSGTPNWNTDMWTLRVDTISD